MKIAKNTIAMITKIITIVLGGGENSGSPPSIGSPGIQPIEYANRKEIIAMKMVAAILAPFSRNAKKIIKLIPITINNTHNKYSLSSPPIKFEVSSNDAPIPARLRLATISDVDTSSKLILNTVKAPENSNKNTTRLEKMLIDKKLGSSAAKTALKHNIDSAKNRLNLFISN